MSRRVHIGAATVLSMMCWPSLASAHLVDTGLGPYYDGISHLALTLEDLVPTIALGFLAGLRGKEFGRWTLILLPLMWLAGGVLGLAFIWSASEVLVYCFSFLVVGALVASDVRIGLRAFVGVALLLGLLHGALNGAAMAESGLGTLGLLGIVTGVFIIVTLSSALVVSLHARWARVAVRVAGSWIVAVGLLLIGWTFRKVS